MTRPIWVTPLAVSVTPLLPVWCRLEGSLGHTQIRVTHPLVASLGHTHILSTLVTAFAYSVATVYITTDGTMHQSTVVAAKTDSVHYFGQGVDVDYEQALPWLQKAAAQDHPDAVSTIGAMYATGQGVAPSWRRAREYYERAIELGNSTAMKNMQSLAKDIQNVMNERSDRPAISRTQSTSDTFCFTNSLPPPLSLDTCSSPPSWTSGWRSMARAGRT